MATAAAAAAAGAAGGGAGHTPVTGEPPLSGDGVLVKTLSSLELSNICNSPGYSVGWDQCEFINLDWNYPVISKGHFGCQKLICCYKTCYFKHYSLRFFFSLILYCSKKCTWMCKYKTIFFCDYLTIDLKIYLDISIHDPP